MDHGLDLRLVDDQAKQFGDHADGGDTSRNLLVCFRKTAQADEPVIDFIMAASINAIHQGQRTPQAVREFIVVTEEGPALTVTGTLGHNTGVGTPKTGVQMPIIFPSRHLLSPSLMVLKATEAGMAVTTSGISRRATFSRDIKSIR